MRRTSILCAAILAALTTAVAASSKTSPTVQVVHTKLGKILVGGDGFTVYVFSKDGKDKDTCIKVKGCAAAWPPLAFSGTKFKPIAGPGVIQAALGTIRVNGSSGAETQVTYYGHPLYTFSNDSAMGDTRYVGTSAFGGKWDAISGTGKVVK